jgi:hypothetical protein
MSGFFCLTTTRHRMRGSPNKGSRQALGAEQELGGPEEVWTRGL